MAVGVKMPGLSLLREKRFQVAHRVGFTVEWREPGGLGAKFWRVDTLVSMKVFRQVVESGGFTAASVALDISVAMVSKHVQHLEGQLGTRLLNRTSRHVSLTSAGTLYFERCRDLLNGLEQAESEVRCVTQRPRGTLRISAPTWFANPFFASMLNSYAEQCPEVQLDVPMSDGRADLVEQGLDLALRVTHRPDPRLPFRELAPMTFRLAASKDYLLTHGRPKTLAELVEHEVITYAHGAEDTLPVPNRPSRWRLDNTTLIAHLAVQGAGIAMLPAVLIDQEPNLEPVLPDLELPPAVLVAVTHESRHLSIRVASFIEHLASHFQKGSCDGHP